MAPCLTAVAIRRSMQRHQSGDGNARQRCSAPRMSLSMSKQTPAFSQRMCPWADFLAYPLNWPSFGPTRGRQQQAACSSDVRRSRRRATRASSSPSRFIPGPAVSCAAYRENSEYRGPARIARQVRWAVPQMHPEDAPGLLSRSGPSRKHQCQHCRGHEASNRSDHVSLPVLVPGEPWRRVARRRLQPLI